MNEKNSALSAFKDYANTFDMDDVMIRLKVDHTLRVAEHADKIAKSLAMTAEDCLFCWLLGLLHDIGRFEQYKRFGTFVDRESIDHAELGADLLFQDHLIDRFPAELTGDASRRKLIETAVRLHNKLTIPGDIDNETRRFCEILRDADKIDIFRVLTEPPYDRRNGSIKHNINDPGARDEIMVCVREHRCVPRVGKRTDFEALLSQCCMAFELCFPESRKLVKTQGYLGCLLDTELANETMRRQMAELRTELEM